MLGPHPFPDRTAGDLPALREILAALDAQHERAATARLSTVRAVLAMSIAAVRQEIARAEAAAPRPATRAAGLFRRFAGDGT